MIHNWSFALDGDHENVQKLQTFEVSLQILEIIDD